jgi:hypothetical protein
MGQAHRPLTTVGRRSPSAIANRAQACMRFILQMEDGTEFFD